VNHQEIYQEFIKSKAILKGHFLLSSGLHSDTYVQCALLLKNPQKAEMLANELIKKIPEEILIKIDLVVAPAMGGLIIGHEIARILKKDFIFFERVNNIFTLKRGFTINKGENILLVEDVITTGGSSIEVIEKVNELGCSIMAEVVLIDRSENIGNKLNFPLISLIKLDLEYFDKDNLPDNLKNMPLVRPGSKKINS
jgi:orotate phosphoribosyltransferase